MSNVPAPGWGPPQPAVPPPPPAAPPLPAPGAQPAPPPPPNAPFPGYQYPPGYAAVAQQVPQVARPPRPDTKVAAWLMMAGAVVVAVGCFLPWLDAGPFSVNGFDDLSLFDDEAPSGYVFMFFAAVMVGFGITTLAAKRLLPIMIIGIVIGSFSLLGAIAELADYNDLPIDLGPGLPVVLAGSALALAGAIAGCSRRRQWPAS